MILRWAILRLTSSFITTALLRDRNAELIFRPKSANTIFYFVKATPTSGIILNSARNFYRTSRECRNDNLNYKRLFFEY